MFQNSGESVPQVTFEINKDKDRITLAIFEILTEYDLWGEHRMHCNAVYEKARLEPQYTLCWEKNNLASSVLDVVLRAFNRWDWR